MFHTTYAHYKPDGSMFYIGKGSVSRAHSASGRNVVWKRTVEKHGGFKVEILGRWKTEQEAFDHEIFLIDTIKKMGVPLVNIAEGGLGSAGFRHTDEHKATLSVRMKVNNPMSDSSMRERQKSAVKAAMNRPDVRRRQSLARIGIKLSESHVESLRNCHPTRPCVINGVEYKSLMEASRMLGIRHGTLYRWLNNPEVKHTGKYAHIVECRWL
jgi:DNA invertase Pin-like site-specific DNA recombinase